jgi:hypothetical protein
MLKILHFIHSTSLPQLSQWFQNNQSLILPILAGISTFTIVVICLSHDDEEPMKKISKINNIKKNTKSGKSEDESQESLETIFDYIVQETDGIPKDQRLADIFSLPLPPSGFKEVFLSSLSRGSSGPYKIKDLINEVKSNEEAIRESKMRLLQYSLEKDRLREDINLLKSQLEAEEQLRIQAESKSSLMHRELDRLHKVNSEHNISREDLKQKIRQIRIEIDLIDASRSDSDDSITKVQKVVAEIQADHTRTKEEVLNLRETNKILTQRTAHQRQKRDQLLKQRYHHQQQLSNLTPKTNLEELEEYEYLDSDIISFENSMRSDGAEGIPIVKPNTELTEPLSEDEKIYY